MADIKYNYYGMLGLSAETFEGDPKKLSEIAEKKIKEWQGHKKIEVQNRANIHGAKIREAINDSVRWKSIYDEYREAVIENIIEQLELFIVDNKILSSNVSDIASKNNVSTNFIKDICARRGYSVDTGSSEKPKSDFSLEKLKPKAYLQIQEAQKAINELGASSLIDLLATVEISGLEIIISESTPKDKVLEALAELEKKWTKIPANGPKGSQKAHIGRICAGFTKFLKDNPFSEYIQYLNYNGAKSILDKLNNIGVKELTENAVNSNVNRLTEFVEGDTGKARSILVDYCSSKGISMPTQRRNYCVCPFCGASFERKEPIQQSCPVCGKSLKVNCPKCGNSKHLLLDTECDGINLGIYPHLEKKLSAIDKCCGILNLSDAQDRLNDLNSQWPNYPGSSAAKSKIDTLTAKYGSELKSIALHCDKKQFYAAKAVIDRIDGAFPGFKNRYSTVYSEIHNAEDAFSEAMAQSDKDKRLSLLLSINDFITDFSKLNIELGKYTVEPITDFSSEVDSHTGIITLKWSSANKPNSVFYSVRRKQETMVSSKDEGIEIARTQNFSCSDSDVEEGKAYYYAVYAMRGPIESPLKTLDYPLLLLKVPELSIRPGDACLELIWKPTNQKLRVFCSDSEITNYGEGNEITNLSSTGVLIENLINGKPYQVAAYKSTQFGGKEYRSKLTILSKVSPVKPITPPKMTKFMGSKAGEYLLVDDIKAEQNLELYYTETLRGIVENNTISQFDMEAKAKKINAVKNSSGAYVIDMAGQKEMFVYPVYNISGTFTVGNMLHLVYVEPVKVSASVSGSSLCLALEKWPDGVDQIYVCYADDSFPQDIMDCDRANRIPVSKAAYQKRPMLDIQNIKMMDYYITLIARKSGNDVPIATVKYSLNSSTDIHYSVTKSFLGDVKLEIHNQGNYRPELTFAVGVGCIPLKKENSFFTYDIPENVSAEQIETINIPKFKLQKDSYVRIFCNAPGYQIIADGSTKIK